jgi:hypothetical protein
LEKKNEQVTIEYYFLVRTVSVDGRRDGRFASYEAAPDDYTGSKSLKFGKQQYQLQHHELCLQKVILENLIQHLDGHIHSPYSKQY